MLPEQGGHLLALEKSSKEGSPGRGGFMTRAMQTCPLVLAHRPMEASLSSWSRIWMNMFEKQGKIRSARPCEGSQWDARSCPSFPHFLLG